ncbi:hypothetical protein PtB15_1B660 [Puccinia triticina]|nr:hypothetical protein PtB15_1B660 [Puccinia triticina]
MKRPTNEPTWQAQASRRHLVQLYNTLARRLDPSGHARRTSVPAKNPLPNRPNKRKCNPGDTERQPCSQDPPRESSPPPPSTNSNIPSKDARPTHVGRVRPTKIQTRKGKFFLLYNQQVETSQTPKSSAGPSSSQTTSPSTRSSTSRASSSSGGYSVRQSPRLRAAREARSPSQTSQSTGGKAQSSLPDIKEESDNDSDLPSARVKMPTQATSSSASESTAPDFSSRQTSVATLDDSGSHSSADTVWEDPASRQTSVATLEEMPTQATSSSALESTATDFPSGQTSVATLDNLAQSPINATPPPDSQPGVLDSPTGSNPVPSDRETSKESKMPARHLEASGARGLLRMLEGNPTRPKKTKTTKQILENPSPRNLYQLNRNKNTRHIAVPPTRMEIDPRPDRRGLFFQLSTITGVRSVIAYINWCTFDPFNPFNPFDPLNQKVEFP